MKRLEQGFALVAALFLIALTSLAASGVAVAWHTQAQRDRELQLLFVGQQYKQAIESYARSSPGAPQLPGELGDLLQDYRTGTLKRHLRRLYPDPMSGEADWRLVMVGGRIAGVFSTSDGKPYRTQGPDLPGGGGLATRYGDWKFVAEAATKIAAAPATVAAVPTTANPTTAPGQVATNPNVPQNLNQIPEEPSPLEREACERSLVADINSCERNRGYPGVTKAAIATCKEVAAVRNELCQQRQGAAAPPLPIPEIKRL